MQCLIEARKAFYSIFEKNSDVRLFENGQSSLAGIGSEAPYYARTKEYFDRVRTPFDYIVLDISQIDHNLLKDRIDPVVFWNIWRLTPAVYEHPTDGWLVKNDLEVLEGAVEENAAYVLENLVDVLLRRQERSQTSRYARHGVRFSISVKTRNAPVYRKADRQSTVQGTLPSNARQVDVSSSVPGLRHSGEAFWAVRYIDKDTYLAGFMHDDDLDLHAPLQDVPPSISDEQLLAAIFRTDQGPDTK